MTAADLLETINGDPRDGTFLVPDVVLNADGLTLDGVTEEELIARAHPPVVFVPAVAEGLVGALAATDAKE